MKKILLGLMALSIAFTTIAQTSEKEGKVIRKHGKHFDKDKFEKLNLSDDQKEQMKSIKEDFKNKMESLKANTALSDEERKTQRQAIVKDHRDRIQSVLTTEQKDRMKELKEDRKGKFEGKGDGKFGKHEKGSKDDKEFRGEKRFEEMSEDLNLSSDQAAKIKVLNEKFKTNIQSIKSNNGLTKEQQKEQMKSLMQAHRTDIQAILTAEQKAKMEAKRKERGEGRRSK